MVLPFLMFDGEAPGDALLIEWVRLFRGGRLPGFGPGLRAGDMFHLSQRKQVAQFGGIQDPGSDDRAPDAVEDVLELHLPDPVTPALHRDRPVPEQERQATGNQVGSQHRLKGLQGHSGLTAQPGNPAAAGIGPGIRRGRRSQGSPVEEKPDPFPELPVARRAPRLLDPGVFIRRNGLGSQLAANPRGLLGEHHPVSGSAGRQRGRDAAHAAPGHQHIGLESWRFPGTGREQGRPGGGGDTRKRQEGSAVHRRSGCPGVRSRDQRVSVPA